MINLQTLRKEKETLLKKFKELTLIKDVMYPNMDIESPMSNIALTGSKMNEIVREIRNISKS